MEYRRPSIIATMLWAFGLIIIGFTIYSMVIWQGKADAMREFATRIMKGLQEINEER
jgi:hypothetical protein